MTPTDPQPAPPVPQIECLVPPQLAGQRLDKVLAQLIPGTSRERLRQLIESGSVSVDGLLPVRPAQSVPAGARLLVELRAPTPARTGSALDSSFEVLYEDEHLIAVAKPAGMVVHPSNNVRGRTLSELAAERWGVLPAPQGEDRPGIVHRLDGDTSGVMVLARSETAAAALLDAFRTRKVHKTYLALTRGEARFDTDWIEAPLGRDPHQPDRVSVLAAELGGRASETYYRTLERFGRELFLPAPTDGFTWMAVEPRTGRTHQIRVHLEHANLPIVGDKLYRGHRAPHLPPGMPVPERQALHAWKLELTHPISGLALSFEAPLAPDIAACLGWLRAKAQAARAAKA